MHCACVGEQEVSWTSRAMSDNAVKVGCDWTGREAGSLVKRVLDASDPSSQSSRPHPGVGAHDVG